MASRTDGNLTVGTGTYGTVNLNKDVSGWTITETAGGAAIVNLRDALTYPSAPSAVDGAAGNSTTGLHMYMVTWVTRAGESGYGNVNVTNYVEATTAGSKIVTLTIPTYSRAGYSGTGSNLVIGRNIYATKAGAPATTVTPTNAQWFLTTATPSTTLAAAMNNLTLPQSVITVAATTSFVTPTTNFKILVTTSQGVQVVNVGAISGATFTGCTGGVGVCATGGAVTAANVMDNTTTTFSLNLADASFTATNPPLVDKSGEIIAKINLAALQQSTDYLGDWDQLVGDVVYVEAQSGTVTFAVRGH